MSAGSLNRNWYKSRRSTLFWPQLFKNTVHYDKGNLTNDDGDGNENIKNSIGLEWQNSKTTTLHVYLACEQALLFGRASLARTCEGGAPVPRGFAALSRVLARLASLAQIGKAAGRLTCIPLFVHCFAVVARLRRKTF